MSISPSRAKATVAALCFGGLAAALTQTMVIPLQSELPTLLDTTASNASWVITITLLAGGVAMPVTGRLADMFGKQRILAIDALILLVGSLLCALSTDFVAVLVGRGLQGLSMGLIPVAISLVREVVPPKMAAGATAAVSATMGVGGAIGLPLAAWIAEKGDWHTLFWVSTGIAAAVFLAVVLVVPHVHDAQPSSFDLVGMVGLGIGLTALLVGLSKANEWGWDSARTVGAIMGGAIVLLVWGIYEVAVAKDPMVDLRSTAKPAVLLTNLGGLAIGFGMMAQSIVVPQWLQIPKTPVTPFGLDQSILEAGLWMAPGGLMMMVFAPISAKLIGSIGAKLTLMIGGVVLAGGYVVASFMMDEPWQMLVATCVVTAGVGIGYAAMPTLILNNVPGREAGAAMGLNSLMRSVGTTIASAVMVTIMTGQMDHVAGHAIPTKDGFQLCFVAGIIAAVIGVAIVALVPKRARPEKPTVEPVSAAGERPLVVVVNNAPGTAQVIDQAADIAAEYHAGLQVVHVRETEPMEQMAVDAETEEQARTTLRRHLDRLAVRGVAADGRVLHCAGGYEVAGTVLAEYADSVDARAIVFGLASGGSFFTMAHARLTAALTNATDRSVLLVSADGAGEPVLSQPGHRQER